MLVKESTGQEKRGRDVYDIGQNRHLNHDMCVKSLAGSSIKDVEPWSRQTPKTLAITIGTGQPRPRWPTWTWKNLALIPVDPYVVIHIW